MLPESSSPEPKKAGLDPIYHLVARWLDLVAVKDIIPTYFDYEPLEDLSEVANHYSTLIDAGILAWETGGDLDRVVAHLARFTQKIHARAMLQGAGEAFTIRCQWVATLAQTPGCAKLAFEQSQKLMSALIVPDPQQARDPEGQYLENTRAVLDWPSEEDYELLLLEAHGVALEGLLKQGFPDLAYHHSKEVLASPHLRATHAFHQAFIEDCVENGNYSRIIEHMKLLNKIEPDQEAEVDLKTRLIRANHEARNTLLYRSGNTSEALQRVHTWQDADMRIEWIIDELSFQLESEKGVVKPLHKALQTELRMMPSEECCEYIPEIIETLVRSKAGRVMALQYLDLVSQNEWMSLLYVLEDEVMASQYISQYALYLGRLASRNHGALNRLRILVEGLPPSPEIDEILIGLVGGYMHQGRAMEASSLRQSITDPLMQFGALATYYRVGLETGVFSINDFPKWVSVLLMDVDRLTVRYKQDLPDQWDEWHEYDVEDSRDRLRQHMVDFWCFLLEHTVEIRDLKQFESLLHKTPFSTEIKLSLLREIFEDA